MFNRFRDSLINPRQILEYRNDSFFRVFLYILLFAVLLSTKTTIETIQFDGVSSLYKGYVRDEFSEVDSSCNITDSVFSCDNESSTLLYKDLIVSYYIDSNETMDFDSYDAAYSIVLHNDSVNVVMANSVMYSMKISELPTEIHNLDFGLLETDEDAFYSQYFGAIDAMLLSTKNMWAPIMIVIDILSGLILFLLFVVIGALLMRMRFKPVKFKQMFAMNAYSATALYVILVLNSLYNLSYFLVLILILVAFRQNTQLSMEIYRRLNSNKKS